MNKMKFWRNHKEGILWFVVFFIGFMVHVAGIKLSENRQYLEHGINLILLGLFLTITGAAMLGGYLGRVSDAEGR